MKSSVESIENLIKYLPLRDRMFALDYLRERNFESLKMLVDSCIKMVRKEYMKAQPEKYQDVDLEMLGMLKVEVDTYSSPLLEETNEREEDY